MMNKEKTRIITTFALLAAMLTGCATLEAPVELPDEALALGPVQADPHLVSEAADDYDIWTRVREGYGLIGRTHPGVEADIRWYARHQKYLDRVAERAENYLFFILEEVEKRGMPTEMALLPVVESAFHPFAYSHGRAAGIWQFIPYTGRRYGMKQDWWYDGRRDIYASTHGALNYLTDLHRRLGGDWLLALAAYNSGEGNVRKALRRAARAGRGSDFWSIRRYLPRETRGYVPKLLAISAIVLEPDAHGVSLLSIPDRPVITKVDIDSQIDLALVSDLADLPLEEVYRINPGFNRWATSPNGPHYIMLPIDNAEVFQANLVDVPANQWVRWKRYRIRSGDSLELIAQRHHTTVSELRKVNRIRGHTIRAGHHLIIPVASQHYRDYGLTADARRAKKQHRPRNGEKIVHLVRAGDTLWDLARKHKISVYKLAKWNSMAPRDPLVTGQRIVIWSQLGKQAAIDPRNFRIPVEGANSRRIRYSVRNGDSLSRISAKFNVSVSQLLRWNSRLKGQKYLQPGQRLTLYVNPASQSS
ncbi:MAG: LysM peptidoglycan-binding domain-containing protein [Gammaproteobacteria bacterium]|nr:LysM peptidoglycan-binding domain-containing protein [Gammaproteobacteria bacterium]